MTTEPQDRVAQVIGIDLAREGSDRTAYIEFGPNGYREISRVEYERRQAWAALRNHLSTLKGVDQP